MARALRRRAQLGLAKWKQEHVHGHHHETGPSVAVRCWQGGCRARLNTQDRRTMALEVGSRLGHS